MRASRVLGAAVGALAVAVLAACVPQEVSSLPEPRTAGSLAAPPDSTVSAPEVVPEIVAEIPTGPIVTPDSIAVAAGTGEIYAPTRNGVVVVDPASRRVVDRIALGSRPRTILADPGAGLVYVSEDSRGVGGVTVLYAATHEVLDRIELTGTLAAGRMALDPSTSRLYVAVGDQGIAVLDTEARELLQFVAVGPLPRGLAVDGPRDLLFVSDGDGITAINTTSLAIVDRFTIGRYPRLTGHGKLAVDEDRGLLLALNEGWGTVTMVDTATREVLRVVRCGARAPGGPFDAAVDPSGGRAYVTGCRQWAVGVIDLETLNLIQVLRPPEATPAGFQTLGVAVAVDPASGSVVLNSDGMVRVVGVG